ncbi:MAG: glycosyltransferase [Tepidisphaeraceae bacterium]
MSDSTVKSAEPALAPRRRRVAVVHHFWAHYRTAVMRELAQNGRHEYVFVGAATDPTGSVKPADAGAIPSDRRIFAPVRLLPPKKTILWQTGLLRLAFRRDIDTIILLGHVAFPATWLCTILARLLGKRVLFWTHGYTREDHGLKRLLRKTFYKLPHALMFYGHYGKCVAIRMGFDPQRIHVLYNSLDLAAQRAGAGDRHARATR